MLDRSTFREFALKGTSWLAELAGRTNPVPPAQWWERLIEPMLSNFEVSFGPAVGSSVITEIRTMLATLESLPLDCEQRDFSPWNVFVEAQGQLLVFDWESSELRGLPATDLIYFLSYLAFFIDGAMDSHRFLDSYRSALTPSTFTGRVVEECFALYAARTGLDPNLLHPLRLAVWLRCSAFEYKHLMSDTGGPPNSEALRASMFLTLMMDELRRVLNSNE